jgi:ribosomal-protein-alanine N-acetyltransferase
VVPCVSAANHGFAAATTIELLHMHDQPDHRDVPVKPPAGARVMLRLLGPHDRAELLALNAASLELHHPWIAAPTTPEQFTALLERSLRPDSVCLLVCRIDDAAIAGVVTLSQIFYGSLRSAYMGYYAGAPFAGRGLLAEGVAQALDYAFNQLQLHRVEANIQPANTASLALVRRLGFSLEGLSRRYLYVDGDWRDHLRFAMLVEDWHMTSDD